MIENEKRIPLVFILPQSTVTSAAKFERMVALVTIIFPFVSFIISMVLLWGRFIGWTDLIICLVMYALTMLGITCGFHRLFTHRSFTTTNPMKCFLGIAGSMAAQGPVYYWAANHRIHHRHSDDENDPHSPHHHDHGVFPTISGWWYAHLGWMLAPKELNYFRLVPDLLRDRTTYKINQYYFYWIAAGLLVPALSGGLISRSWLGAVTGLVWGGLTRIFLVHHSTWSINSACHLFGTQAFRTGDESRNNVICAIFTFGEGWHNNHHAFPTSARHGLRWWELDLVYYFIWFLTRCGVAWEARLPEASSIETKRMTPY